MQLMQKNKRANYEIEIYVVNYTFYQLLKQLQLVDWNFPTIFA